MGQFDRTYYGSKTDIELAKRSGLQGNFYDVSTYGDESKYNDLLHAYKTGANPVILGGAGAVGGINDSMYQRLINSGANIERIGGKDRYDVQTNFRNYVSSLQNNQNQYNSDQLKQQLTQQGKDQVNVLYDTQKKSQLDQLKAQRDKAIGGINQQKAELAPQYQAQRNQSDVVNQQQVQRLRELMAANGLTATGENVSANVALSNQRQNSLNQLNLQEQQQVNDYNRQITGLNDPSQEQALISQIEAQRAQALLEAQNRAEDKSYLQSRDSISDQRYNQEWNSEKAWREYTFANMSATEKTQLEWAKQQYGEEAAWRLFETKYNGELAKSTAQAQLASYQNLGFNGVEGGGETSSYKNNYKTEQQAQKSPNYKTYRTHLSEAIKMGVPASWSTALTELVGRESSWNSNAKNPTSTAHGYGQFLSSTRSNYEKKMGISYSDPVNQLVMMAQYVKDRYGTPEKALAFWDKNKWY